MTENVDENVNKNVNENKDAGVTGNLWYEAWLRFRRNKLAMLGLCMIAALLGIAALAPQLAPYDPLKQLIWTEGVKAKLAAPSSAHWLGPDAYGRDIMSRVIYGSRLSLQIGLLATVVSLLIGVPLGAVAGYFGGWVDDLISWLINVIFAFPFMLCVLAIVAVVNNPSMVVVFTAIGLVSWVSIARVTRAQFMSLREREYIEATKAIGLPTKTILFKHILPNTLAPVIVQATLGIGSIILTEAGLAFLGFGAQPPAPSWGLMISDGQQYLATGQWWWALFPGMAIMYTVLAFNFLGDGLRDALDVRLKR